NLPMTRSRMRARVHRWSCHPAASGPASSNPSSAASCASSRRHRAACPREANPAAPPSSHACRHRRTDRSLTRSSAAITADGTRCSNRSTASSRTRSRRLRASAVNPPPCAYRIHPAYRQQPHPSAHGHHELKIFKTKLAEERLAETRDRLTQAAGEDAEQAWAALEAEWAIRMRDLLEEDPGAEADLRTLVQEVRARLPVGMVSAA